MTHGVRNMKLICEKKSFCQAVSVTSRAVSARTSLPVLEGLLLSASDGGLDISGYDLEIGIRTSVEAKVEQKGSIVVPARVLMEIARRVPGETIEMSVDDRCLVELVSDDAEYQILGIAAEEFPEFPQISSSSSLSIPQNVLKSMIDQTIYAVAQIESKPVHTGCLFETGSGEQITVVGVDGYRLALRRENVRAEKDVRFVVPGKALAEISKILADNDDETRLFVGKKHILFEVDGYRVFSRLLEGDFINYQASIPIKNTTKARVQTRLFIDSVERASLLISDRIKSPLRVRFENNTISSSCSTALGRAFDRIAAQVEGEALEIGFNNRYLLDALKNCDCDEVGIELSGALSPMKITAADSDSFLFLVLPVRLKSEA
jgi:DNA polymerase-3 subunit beta